jgi:hypothetical protein
LWETENRIDGAAVDADLADYDLDQLGMVPFSKAVGGGYRSNPVDRGKPGSKIHVLPDHTGVPLTVLISAANVHDSQLMVPLLDSIAPIRAARGRPRHRPGKLHADKAYNIRALRAEIRRRGLGVRIARKGVESSPRVACPG